MVDEQTIAGAVAVAVLIGDAVFVVAMAFVVAKHFGAWEAVAVAAGLIVANGVVGLYAIGQTGDAPQRDRIRYGGR